MSRLVTVSNRVAIPKVSSAPGGLSVGVLSALRARGGLWFGWNGETDSPASSPPEITVRDGITFATIGVSQQLHERSYCGFANGTLWPLFHYFLDGFRYDSDEYEGYEAVNRQFADALLPLLRPDDLIWVHDYHLISLAEKLRAQGIGSRLGFFLHIPFPHFEVLRALPPYAHLMRALLSYDVVGFQTDVDRQAFLGAVEMIWGSDCVTSAGSVAVGDRLVMTEVCPIGVDLEAVSRSAIRATDSVAVQRMRQGLLSRRLIIGVDRLDYSKGLLERFEAYRHFLEACPEQRGNVTYMQIAPLGRQNVAAYARIRDSLEQSAGRTNGRFADTDWTPIRYLNRNFPHSSILGFMRTARVCLVTPLRDGMNLVAKEFIAAQDPTDPGVLILSDRAGAACELTAALLVNPYDTHAIASALKRALDMPLEERRQRHAAQMDELRRRDIHCWRERFLQALEALPVSRSGRNGIDLSESQCSLHCETY